MNAEPSMIEEAFWRLPTVEERTALDASTITRMEAAGTFPARRRIGERAVAWLASEVVAWMRAQPLAAEVAAANPPPPRSQKRAA